MPMTTIEIVEAVDAIDDVIVMLKGCAEALVLKSASEEDDLSTMVTFVLDEQIDRLAAFVAKLEEREG